MQLTTRKRKEEIEQAIKDGKKVLYRYHDVWGYDGNEKKVELFAYIAIRETPKGVWIEDPDRYGQEKWVDTHPGKKSRRFAYLDKDKAMESFIARKTKQVQILKQQLYGVRTAMASINKPIKEELIHETLEGSRPRPSSNRSANQVLATD